MTSSPLTRVALKVIGIKYPQQHYCLLRVYSIRELGNENKIILSVRIILLAQAMFPVLFLGAFWITRVKKLRFHGDVWLRNRLRFRILMPLVGKLLCTSCQKPTLGLLVDQTLIRYALCCLRNCIKSQQEIVMNLTANQFGDQSHSSKMATF